MVHRHKFLKFYSFLLNLKKKSIAFLATFHSIFWLFLSTKQYRHLKTQSVVIDSFISKISLLSKGFIFLYYLKIKVLATKKPGFSTRFIFLFHYDYLNGFKQKL